MGIKNEVGRYLANGLLDLLRGVTQLFRQAMTKKGLQKRLQAL